MVSVIDVASYVLELTGNVTTMKLQKLIYYAQARYLVLSGVSLFSDRIEAWANGPVAPSLFRAHSGKYIVGKGSLNGLGFSSNLSQSQRSAIERVVDLFGGYSGEQLRELTHKEDPWVDARGGLEDGERCNREIAVEAIRRFYASPTCSNPVAV